MGKRAGGVAMRRSAIGEFFHGTDLALVASGFCFARKRKKSNNKNRKKVRRTRFIMEV